MRYFKIGLAVAFGLLLFSEKGIAQTNTPTQTSTPTKTPTQTFTKTSTPTKTPSPTVTATAQQGIECSSVSCLELARLTADAPVPLYPTPQGQEPARCVLFFKDVSGTAALYFRCGNGIVHLVTDTIP